MSKIKYDKTIKHLQGKEKILFLLTSNRWDGHNEIPKSSALAYKMQEELGKSGHSFCRAFGCCLGTPSVCSWYRSTHGYLLQYRYHYYIYTVRGYLPFLHGNAMGWQNTVYCTYDVGTRFCWSVPYRWSYRSVPWF